MRTIFDVGMYDGADTEYYLAEGYRVVSIEANPMLVQAAEKKFARQIASAQLLCVHCAISNDESVELLLSGQDLGSSSVLPQQVENKRPVGSIRVPGLSTQELISRYGVPHYLKVDIEGADRVCVLALSKETCPQYLSFELGDDVDELVSHAAAIGLRKFKIINQVSFRELANQECWPDRFARRVMRSLGYAEPRLVKRAGRFFVSGHSSGPAPWCSDGAWYSAQEVLARWHEAQRERRVSGWYDVHAAVSDG